MSLIRLFTVPPGKTFQLRLLQTMVYCSMYAQENGGKIMVREDIRSRPRIQGYYICICTKLSMCMIKNFTEIDSPIIPLAHIHVHLRDIDYIFN